MRQAQIFLKYVDWIGEGDATRLEAAQEFGVTKSTAAYHLGKAVEGGYLEKFYTWTRANQTGWAYRKPESNADMFTEYGDILADCPHCGSPEQFSWQETNKQECADCGEALSVTPLL